MSKETLTGGTSPQYPIVQVHVQVTLTVDVMTTPTSFEVVGVHVPAFRAVVEEMRRQLVDAGMPDEALRIR